VVCTPVKLPGGMTAIVCSRGPRGRNCSACGAFVNGRQVLLCDYPTDKEKRFGTFARPRNSKTCDKALCPKCAVHVGPDKDYCPSHKERPAQGEMDLGTG
jgi:succinate dehydrogenase/fumarate reductase-like Fe-S protein